jgi:hypothetical protein
MPTAKIITPGTRFGRWTALDQTQTRTYPSGTSIHFRLCQCDCGTIQVVGENKLRIGHSRSCGCLQAEVTTERSLKHGHSKRGKRTRVYGIWRNILTRCTNPNVPSYEDYGARGITVCERWLTFENFLEDMGEPPNGLTIDRLENSVGYCKENCAWRTPLEQARNTRRNVKLTFDGLTLTMKEWAERLNISYRMLRGRYENNWSVERILTEPKNPR